MNAYAYAVAATSTDERPRRLIHTGLIGGRQRLSRCRFCYTQAMRCTREVGSYSCSRHSTSIQRQNNKLTKLFAFLSSVPRQTATKPPGD